jgi:hypothetical protein
MNTPEETELLIEAAASAQRPRDPRTSEILPHPAWSDLDGPDRLRAFEAAVELRALESALDPEGVSTTARAVLARIAARR